MATFQPDPWTAALTARKTRGPNVVSTTAETAPLPGGGMTLDALMQRAKERAQPGPMFQEIASPWQGAANMAQAGLSGFMQGRAEREAADANTAFSGALSRVLGDPAGGTPEDQAAIAQYDPGTALALWKVRQEQQNQEQWIDTAPPPGAKEGTLWQKNSKTGEVRAVGSGGIVINPPSAETSAKLGLAQGFFDNYDTILKSVDAGELTGPGYVTGVTMGRGAGGAAWRNLKQGTDALTRLLTGAGMSQSEAENEVAQYLPAWTDDAATLRSKVEGLHQALTNVKAGVEERGRPDANTEPPPEDQEAGVQKLLQQARDAIAAGKDPEAVKKRLLEMGFKPEQIEGL